MTIICNPICNKNVFKLKFQYSFQNHSSDLNFVSIKKCKLVKLIKIFSNLQMFRNKSFLFSCIISCTSDKQFFEHGSVYFSFFIYWPLRTAWALRIDKARVWCDFCVRQPSDLDEEMLEPPSLSHPCVA